MSKSTLIFVLIFILFAVTISPLLFIWSLNTLFGLKIAFGFFEWLAALILVGTLTGGGARFTGKSE